MKMVEVDAGIFDSIKDAVKTGVKKVKKAIKNVRISKLGNDLRKIHDKVRKLEVEKEKIHEEAKSIQSKIKKIKYEYIRNQDSWGQVPKSKPRIQVNRELNDKEKKQVKQLEVQYDNLMNKWHSLIDKIKELEKLADKKSNKRFEIETNGIKTHKKSIKI